ncbi:uncharacterized protein PHACADRAFT_253276 [Phanerochaete carnosa HHB-10118-sp]|uniref:Uncharacterized protein n=1 Tax=Phanerochaete carnosa (strain HHB-10118-sp) TaxID=650164 RepID=K5WAL1_PHACS|nr:uncharacterized protein PHACADRAFT_253276 [Phanerochaete carnosa HHB-10118-sp]EKM56250.1 hypothetical protein PHACADRAFT_253276 [Phanerochaete carnosa HHB-10118-sp]
MLVSTLFVQALLTTTAFALPSFKERHEARVARRASGVRSSHPRITNETYTEYSPNWAGAVLSSDAGTYKSVTATFTVPTPQEPSGSSGSHSAAAWVGIDGDTCQNAILQTGIEFTIDDGQVSYEAWYEWYPEPSYDFTDISISPGDSVTLSVTASSTTSGTVVITNESNGQSVTQAVSSSYELCQQDAEWIVEDFEQNGSQVPFANFGTVTFAGASAGTSLGSVGPSGATIWDIELNDQVVTSASVSDSSVTVSYV